MKWRIPEKFHAVDFHTHVNLMLGKDYTSLRKDEAAAMLESGDMLGVEKFCVSLPYMEKTVPPEAFRRGNDIMFEAMAFSPRYIGFCFVDPGHMAESCDEIRRCVRDGGMAGVKLYHQFRIDDPALAPLLELCEELSCPVLVHAVKGTYPETLSNAGHFVTAARRFPGVNFIEGHIGGGGDWEWNLRVLEDSPANLFIDTGGSVIDHGMIRRTVDTVGEDRVLFATDMFMAEGVGKLLSAGLSETVLKKIFRDNAAGLLKGRGL